MPVPLPARVIPCRTYEPAISPNSRCAMKPERIHGSLEIFVVVVEQRQVLGVMPEVADVNEGVEPSGRIESEILITRRK